MGAWTPISYYSGHEYESEAEATNAAGGAVPWLATVVSG